MFYNNYGDYKMAAYNYVMDSKTKKMLFKSNDSKKCEAFKNKIEKETGNKDLCIGLPSDEFNKLFSRLFG
jgi:hypothetical protein